jgi:hypothetical protein
MASPPAPILPTTKSSYVEDDVPSPTGEDADMSGTSEDVNREQHPKALNGEQHPKARPKNNRPGWDADVYKTMKKINKLAPDDYYGFLSLKKTCSATEIKDQYKSLALLTHPDKNKFPDAKRAFQREFLSYRY